VNVSIVLEPVKRYRRSDAEDVPLERQARIRKLGRTGTGDEVTDAHVSRRQEARPILERLDRPALDSAGEAKLVRRRTATDKCGGHDDRNPREEQDKGPRREAQAV
jgi:hypothetical protein